MGPHQQNVIPDSVRFSKVLNGGLGGIVGAVMYAAFFVQHGSLLAMTKPAPHSVTPDLVRGPCAFAAMAVWEFDSLHGSNRIIAKPRRPAQVLKHDSRIDPALRQWTQSIQMMAQIFGGRMFPLTLEGLDDAMRMLVW